MAQAATDIPTKACNETKAPAAIPEPGPLKVELAITTGQGKYAGVGDGRKVQITPMGLRFVGKMTWDQWYDLLRSAKLFKECGDFIYADIIGHGRREFGDALVAEAIEQLQFDWQDTLRAYAIGQILFDFRSEKLSSEHYYVLGSAITDEKERMRWAAIAEKHELSALELKKSIEAGKVVRQEDVNSSSGRGAGIANMQALRFWFGRWEKQAGGHEAILKWPSEQKRKWLDEVKPIVDLYKEMEGTIE